MNDFRLDGGLSWEQYSTRPDDQWFYFPNVVKEMTGYTDWMED
jgi:hypothetical protein